MISEELIKELAHRKAWRYKHSTEPQHSDTYTFNDMCLIDLCRAIEAEAQRVPDELVDLIISYLEMRKDWDTGVLLHHIRVGLSKLSAAPEPVQQCHKCGHESHTDECVIVTNGHIGEADKMVEPVQQEAKPLGPATPEDQAIYNAMVENYEQEAKPVAWVYTINKSHSVFSAEKPPEDAYDEGTLFPLYDAPPTEAAIRADEREKMLAELRLLADAEGRVHLWEVE